MLPTKLLFSLLQIKDTCVRFRIVLESTHKLLMRDETFKEEKRDLTAVRVKQIF